MGCQGRKKVQPIKKTIKTKGLCPLWFSSCVDVCSVSYAVCRLIRKTLNILGRMQRHWHEAGHFWLDEGSAAFYSSIKMNYHGSVKASLGLIQTNILLTVKYSFHFSFICKATHGRTIIFISYLHYLFTKMFLISSVWSNLFQDCTCCRIFFLLSWIE